VSPATGSRSTSTRRSARPALVEVPRFPTPAAGADAGSLLAPMPGLVVAVPVALGDAVTAGQPLVVLEAMKMQHTVAAPTDGTVTGLPVAVGDQVDTGTVLAVVATGTAAAATAAAATAAANADDTAADPAAANTNAAADSAAADAVDAEGGETDAR